MHVHGVGVGERVGRGGRVGELESQAGGTQNSSTSQVMSCHVSELVLHVTFCFDVS